MNASIRAMTSQPDEMPESATMGDLLVQFRRIADALESKVDRCGEKKGQATCGLLPTHIGYHVTPDGRTHWLDEE